MKRVKIAIALVLTLALSVGFLPVAAPVAVRAAGGYGANGKFLAPIEAPVAGSTPISNRAGLEAMKNNLSGSYHLTADIDLSSAWWVPVGDKEHPFSGTFDGQGHVIKGLSIGGNGHVFNGLFGYLNTFSISATIKNVGMESTNIDISCKTGSLTGAIIGCDYGPNRCQIINCYNTGSVSLSTTSGECQAGGLSGGGGSFINCYNTGAVTSSSTVVGTQAAGICAKASTGSEFENCYNSGKITSVLNAYSGNSSYAAGICAYTSSNRVRFDSCYNSGEVSVATSFTNHGVFEHTSSAGGIFGTNALGSTAFSDCYNTGSVSANGSRHARAGGINAESSAAHSVKNCYNVGSISAKGGVSTYTGGLCGPTSRESSVVNSYCLDLYGSEYGAQLTSTQMKDKANFANWNFNIVWDISSSINSGYPFLRSLTPGGGGGSVTQPPATGGWDGGFGCEAISVGVKIWWDATPGGVGYRVYRSENPSDEGISITDFYITTTEFIDVNVKSDTTYYYYMRQVIKEANPLAGQREELSPPSDKVAVTTLPSIIGEDMPPPTPGAERMFILMTLDDPYMNTNGSLQEIDPGRGTTPLLVSSRTMVPVRAIVEEMGGSAGWEQSNREVSLECGDNTVIMWLDTLYITVNGEQKDIDVAPKSINDRTMVPIRFAAENLGCEIDWLNSTKQIVIVYYMVG